MFMMLKAITFESPTFPAMDIATLRQRLHGHIDRADQSKLLSLLKIAEDDGGQSSIPEELLRELERRWEEYLRGDAEPLSFEESQRLARAILDRAE
jgi:hypothetical protein